MKLPWKVSENEHGLRVSFRVPGDRTSRTLRFPRGTSKRDMEAAVQKRVEELKLRIRAEGEAIKGGFAADVQRYLKLANVRQLASFEDRKRHMDRFAARFGNRDRLGITKQELETVLGEWQQKEKWKPGTLNKYVTALKHFYTALDDPEGRLPNPARKIRRQTEPDPQPRAIPYETIHKIFDVMGRTDTVPPEVDAEIRQLFAEGMTRLNIAEHVGFSKETVGKVLKREPATPGDEESLAKIRLRVIAFTGLRHSQVAKLRPENYDRENKQVWVTGNKGTNSFWKPLDDEGIAALDALAEVNAWGDFNRKSLHRAWKTALKRLKLPETLRPYDLRHSYLSEIYIATGDLGAVQAIGGHRQLKTVQRYTGAAVDPLARKAIEAVAPRLRRKNTDGLSSEVVVRQKRSKLALVAKH